jgi:hypothetical protein
MSRKRFENATSLSCFLLFCACGPPAGRGPGMLLDAKPIAATLDAPATITFDVQLACGAGGPMYDIESASATLTSPSGEQTNVDVVWKTEERTYFDCTPEVFQRVTYLTVGPLDHRAAGTWTVTVTLAPEVGTFSRELNVAP